MLTCLCMALASVKFVANTLFASDTVEGTPAEALSAPKIAAVTTPDRGDRVAPVTIVTGDPVPVGPMLVAASQADERSTPHAGSASGPGGPLSSGAETAARGFTMHQQEREEPGGPSRLANSTAVTVQDGIHGPEEQLESLRCIPCDAMFRKVEETQRGTKVQNVNVQIRGEPKSGTTFMYEWAANALMVACGHIESMYGVGTCTVGFVQAYTAREGEIAPINSNTTAKSMKRLFLDFDPKRWRGPVSSNGTDVGAACPCENLDRVLVSVRNRRKHSFPVGSECPWQHIDNITPAEAGCSTIDGREDGRRVEDYRDTAKCFDANPCKVVGDEREKQMLILRDPRAVTVSTYFHLKPFPNAPAHPIVGESIDDFVVRMMPTLCRYIHIRYLLLAGLMRDRTAEFLYDESWADPLGWHRRFLSLIGLSPLDSIVEKAADTAIRRDFGFKSPGANAHPGGAAAVKTRTWEDEVSASLKDRMDDMCRVWLPPVLRETLGISPQSW
eukprot:g7715.t1